MGFAETLLFLKEHENNAEVIMKYLKTHRFLKKNNFFVLSIFGIPGSGKSETAFWLERKLYKKGISAHRISMDRYYKVPVEKREEYRREIGDIGKNEIDWEKINREFNYYSKGGASVLIFEGLYAGYIKMADVKVYIKKKLADTLEFRVARGKEDPKSTWRKYVVAQERKAVSNSRKYADLII